MEKAFFLRTDLDIVMKIPFLFNPEDFTVEKGNKYAEVSIPGLSLPIYQFVSGEARSITMDIFFDTYATEDTIARDVRIYTDLITGWDSGSILSGVPGLPSAAANSAAEIREAATGVGVDSVAETAVNLTKGLMDIDSELHSPPVCLFIWGTYIFKCIIERVSKKYTMFLPDGTPVRATLNITMKEYKEVVMQLREIDLHSSDLTKKRLVKEGDSLWSISAKEYGDPGEWRIIAEANNIENPVYLHPGIELLIPVKD